MDMDASTDEALASRKLHKRGLVTILPDNRLTFTSILHRAYCMWKIYAGRLTGNVPANLDELLFTVVQRMDPHVLSNTLSLRTTNSLLERCWQMEVYWALMCSLPAGTVPSPDVGQTLAANGCVDFFLPASYKAAVELTRDGHNLTQHLQRFRETSKYKPMFDGGVAESFAILDMRSPGQSPPQFRDEHLWTVLMDADFQSATVYHGGSPLKKLKLIGDAGEESRNALRAAAARFG
eukprot:TRINITY_DN7647_c0_g1_i2.p1 TRINITY_DN7647_c0_g1~~TRINITY_DN7647_c0_g1_i2.p1  ORF type:complete len:236 (+),score=47.46 TRINITY_DN7647_c0_g1_i2:835-1542(+)